MGEYISVSVRLPVEIHQKLKIMSAVSSRPMNELFIQWVESQKVVIPGYVQTDKPQKTKTVKKKQVPNDELKETIMKLKAEGLSLQAICDRLDAEGIPTAKGGKWSRGTIANMLKRWTPDALSATRIDGNPKGDTV